MVSAWTLPQLESAAALISFCMGGHRSIHDKGHPVPVVEEERSLCLKDPSRPLAFHAANPFPASTFCHLQLHGRHVVECTLSSRRRRDGPQLHASSTVFVFSGSPGAQCWILESPPTLVVDVEEDLEKQDVHEPVAGSIGSPGSR